MKLRIRANTLRLRLVRAEVDELLATGQTREAMPVPGASLGYAFALDDAATPGTTLTLQAAGAELRVTWPRAEAEAWARDPSAVSLRGKVTWSAAGVDQPAELSLLVEKDFPCLVVREGEDDSDAFARPDGTPSPTC